MATITTIIATRNRAGLIGRAIRSVRAQTFGDFSLCIYDNASEDETPAAVARAAAGDPRVAYVRHDADIGAIENFRFGMRRVVTPFFSFLSDDDVLLPWFYESALEGFARHADAMLSACSTIEVGGDGSLRFAPVEKWKRTGVFAPPDGAYRMLGNLHPTWTTVLFRREAIAQVGELDPAVGSPADLDYELRVALRFPIVVSPRPCGAYVSHAAASSSGERASIVLGYERMRDAILADDRIDRRVRRRIGARLRDQIRLKLIEIWAKSLLRGDDGASLGAAIALRKRGPWIAGAWLTIGWFLIVHFPPLRGVLRAIESERLSHRAESSTSPQTAASLPDIRKALVP